MPEELIVTNKNAYIRFHGDPSYSASYTDQALSKWVQKIDISFLKESWVYFNNSRLGYAAQNALKFRDLIVPRCG